MKFEIKRYEINNEEDLRNILDKIYEVSKQDIEVYDLVDLMKNEQTIISAIHKIKANKGSKTQGIDGADINKYLQMDTKKLIDLIRQCIDNYNPKPVRRVYIPKKNGKKRPLGIPTMLDRIIQEITKMVIEPIVEAKFFNHSYGFRPYRSAEHAIGRINHIVNTTPCKIAIEGDIKSFFDNVDHNKLIRIMWNMGIRDKRILMIVKKMLKAGIMEDFKYIDSDTGTPQGGIISPILANIYLNVFDQNIAKQYEEHPYLETYMKNSKSKKRKVALDNARKKVKKEHSQMYLVRYADDWIILTESIESANKILNHCRKFLKYRLSLELSEEKTMITDLSKNKVRFLGFEIFLEKRVTNKRMLCKVIPDREAVITKTRDILDSVEAIRYQETPLKVAIQVEKVNSKILGFTNYYKICIAKRIFRNLDNKIYYTTLKTIRRLYGSGKDRLIQINEVNNLTNRHMNYKMKTFFFDYKDMKIGITKAVITPIKYARRFNPEMTPYTEEGRAIRFFKDNKWRNKDRPTLYNPYELFKKAGKDSRIYNFEYVMNREYAFNRDRGKCSVCKTFVYPGNINCHHKKRNLPLNLINKVNNLTTLCNECHSEVHSNKITNNKKIIKLREIYNQKL